MSKLTPIALKKQTPSPRYFGFWPGMQDSGDGRTQILDTSGQGRHMGVGVNGTYAAVTGTNSQWATIVGAAAGQDKSLATAGVFTWDLFAGQSLILQATMNAAPPGATAHIFNARGSGADVKGMAFTVDLNGKPVVFIRDTVATQSSNLPTNILADSTDHTFRVEINGTAKTMQIFIDGAPISTHASPQAITSTSGSTQSDDPVRWGGAGDFVAAASPTWVNGANLKLRHMHLLVMDSWPDNIAAIRAELLRNPHRPISARLLP
mgnify:CR=1 FL=1